LIKLLPNKYITVIVINVPPNIFALSSWTLSNELIFSFLLLRIKAPGKNIATIAPTRSGAKTTDRIGSDENEEFFHANLIANKVVKLKLIQNVISAILRLASFLGIVGFNIK
jgi:hypothetical protein